MAIIDPRHAAKQLIYERIFRSATLSAAVLVLLILGGVALSLVRGAWPALSHFGFSFVSREIWNPVTDQFGALAPIYGTVVTSAIAMLLAVPAGFGIALFLTEMCPPLLKRPIGVAVELLAAVPSIIFGIWGLFVLAPVLQRYVQPWLIAHLGHAPFIGGLFKGPPYGIGILTAGVVLAIMVLPFIAATMRDVFDTVPPMLKESGYGLGATTWEVIWNVVVPYSRVGIVGGIMLGLGRWADHGEPSSSAMRTHQLFVAGAGTAISSAIASEFTEALAICIPPRSHRLGVAAVFHHLHGDRPAQAMRELGAGSRP